ncbi:MAG TPA: DAHL domain-containing protein [Terriglobales bacterium]|nr:DAHL domain-containing protein [Terriglobales bacterium]
MLKLVQYGLVVAGVAIVFIVLSVQSQLVNEGVHNQYSSDLSELDRLQATLNEDILRARLGLLTYFDPLNNTLDELDAVRNRLGTVPNFIDEQGHQDIAKSLETYDGLMVQKRNYIESFKTNNAVLVNSLSYFTIVVSDVTDSTRDSQSTSNVADTVDSLLQDILLYNMTANPELVFRIQNYISQLSENQDDFAAKIGSDKIELDALINNANLILQRKPVTDALIATIFNLTVPQQISETSSLYNAHFQTAQQQANLYQLALYVFSLIVLGYIAISIILRLRKSAVILQQAKEQLEVNNLDLAAANRDARDANRMKDLFLATMSHELRTPLNAMIGFLYLMIYSGQMDEDNVHMAERSLANTQRLLTLINNILDLSRIATGGLEIVPSQMEPRQVAAGLYSDLKLLAQDKGLRLELEVDQTLPETINHDEARLSQIVTNLVSNAIKFTEAGTIKLVLKRRDDRLIIQVADTGVGIPQSKQHLIFDDFFQVDATSTRSQQGAGLGLAIVKRLILLMNGTINLVSEVDKGSVFTVEVPLELPRYEPGDRRKQAEHIFANSMNGSNDRAVPVA